MDEHEKFLWISLPREVDHYHVEKLGRQVDEELLQKPVECLVFDFKETDFMDSSGVGLVMGRLRTIRTFGGRVYLTNESRRIRQMFQVSGVYEYMGSLADTEKEEEE
ncbi:MAG: STAS domain-containing protein [Lachnospiraceae bacterium]|nr:STAS domain-containing protein [Lachnospiraceae bacterium]